MDETEGTRKVLKWLDGVSVGEEFNYNDTAVDTDYSTNYISKVLTEMAQNPFKFGIVKVRGPIWKKIAPFDAGGNANPSHITSFQIQVLKRLKQGKLLISYDGDLYTMTKLEI